MRPPPVLGRVGISAAQQGDEVCVFAVGAQVHGADVGSRLGGGPGHPIGAPDLAGVRFDHPIILAQCDGNRLDLGRVSDRQVEPCRRLGEGGGVCQCRLLPDQRGLEGLQDVGIASLGHPAGQRRLDQTPCLVDVAEMHFPVLKQ